MRSPLYLLALAMLPACAQKHVASQTRPAPTRPRTVSTIPINTALGDTVLVFQRTPCFGKCPTYTATVFRNGRVEYLGERWVPVLGKHTTQLPAATVTEMLAAARRIDFNSLPPQFTGNVSDLPGVIIAVYQPGQHVHRVEGNQNMPENLQGYITYLRSQLDPVAGIGADK